MDAEHGIKVSEMTIRAFAARRSLAAFADAARPPLSLASRKLRRTFARWMKRMWRLNPNWHEWVVWSDESIVTRVAIKPSDGFGVVAAIYAMIVVAFVGPTRCTCGLRSTGSSDWCTCAFSTRARTSTHKHTSRHCMTTGSTGITVRSVTCLFLCRMVRQRIARHSPLHVSRIITQADGFRTHRTVRTSIRLS
ncbi:MAG: hypothetical protein MHM6MM_009674 [Cercozoa sp. M6MM]